MRGLVAEAQVTLQIAVERHHPRLVMACSFQKEESVLIDLLMGIEPSARVFTIDTGVLFPETYETWRRIEDRYGLKVEVVDALPPNGTPWSASSCCGARKVEALERALDGTAAWITGIRRERSGSSIRSSTGATGTCGATCRNTISPTIPSTTGVTLPSDAPLARCQATAGKDAGPARRRRSAGCTSDV